MSTAWDYFEKFRQVQCFINMFYFRFIRARLQDLAILRNVDQLLSSNINHPFWCFLFYLLCFCSISLLAELFTHKTLSSKLLEYLSVGRIITFRDKLIWFTSRRRSATYSSWTHSWAVHSWRMALMCSSSAAWIRKSALIRWSRYSHVSPSVPSTNSVLPARFRNWTRSACLRSTSLTRKSIYSCGSGSLYSPSFPAWRCSTAWR